MENGLSLPQALRGAFSQTHPRLGEVIRFVLDHHFYQRRLGESLAMHALRVGFYAGRMAQNVLRDDQVVLVVNAGLLHEVTDDDGLRQFGEPTVELVRRLRRRQGESDGVLLQRLAPTPSALWVKLGDELDIVASRGGANGFEGRTPQDVRAAISVWQSVAGHAFSSQIQQAFEHLNN